MTVSAEAIAVSCSPSLSFLDGAARAVPQAAGSEFKVYFLLLFCWFLLIKVAASFQRYFLQIFSSHTLPLKGLIVFFSIG